MQRFDEMNNFLMEHPMCVRSEKRRNAIFDSRSELFNWEIAFNQHGRSFVWSHTNYLVPIGIELLY